MSIVYSESKCFVSGVYTESLLPSSAVLISKKNIKKQEAHALVVLSKNANVATGTKGYNDTKKIMNILAHQLDITESSIQIAGIGVIGHRYPMSKIISGLSDIREKFTKADFLKVADGIRTTDKHAKIYSEKIGPATLSGITKGVGMIEPNMATLLVYFFSDADIPKYELDVIFKKVINKTFNCISIDTDTSTSDSAVIFVNRLAGKINLKIFEDALLRISLKLLIDILKDGEGASKIIETHVNNAHNYSQAKDVGKSIINSPLVKTAIYGADPNWGRIIMAIGKCKNISGLSEDKIKIKINDFEVYPQILNKIKLKRLQEIMHNNHIIIDINLNAGNENATVWGC